MTTKNDTINWGLIGLGNIASQFIEDLHLVKGAKPYAVAARKLEKAEAFARDYGAPQAYGSLEQMLEDGQVDIVYIATPHNSHAEIAIECLNAGKHVLCEKPLSVNLDQARRMVEISKKSQRFLMEANWSRFNPVIEEALQLVKDKAIGEVNYVQADFSFYRDDPDHHRMLDLQKAGGSLLDLGVYPVFLIYSVFGKPEEILATARFHRTGADIQTAVIFKYKNGMATMLSGFESETDLVAKIYGTEGRIYLNSIWNQTDNYQLVKGINLDTESKTVRHPKKGQGFTYEIEESMACIRQGRIESPKWTHQNSLDMREITDEIRRKIGLTYPFEE